ncbi:MAG: LysR family transcriptional regulator [Gemmobacter sp.]
MPVIARRDINALGLRVLRAFDALMTTRHVTRAARRLGMTQQGLSGQIARARDFFGDPLFQRGSEGMVPSPLAESLWPQVRQALDALDRLETSEVFDPARLDRAVTLATSDYAMALLLPQLLAQLRAAAPRLRVAVQAARSDRLATALQDRQVDLALTVPQFTPPGLSGLVLLSDHYLGAVRDGHPLTQGPVDLAAFCAWPHLLVSPDKGDFRGPVDDALAALGLQREVALVVPGFSVVASILAATDLVAVLPARLLSRVARPLHVFDPPVAVPGFDLCAFWPARLDDDPTSRWLRTTCAAVAQDAR